MRRRWFLQVIRDLLAVEAGTKADLMFAGRLNSDQLKRYLQFMIDNGLKKEVSREGAGCIYVTTENGRKVLAQVGSIIDFVGIDSEDSA